MSSMWSEQRALSLCRRMPYRWVGVEGEGARARPADVLHVERAARVVAVQAHAVPLGGVAEQAVRRHGEGRDPGQDGRLRLRAEDVVEDLRVAARTAGPAQRHRL